MIDINTIYNHKWQDTKISILGAGKSGMSAANLCKEIGAKPFISDNNNTIALKNKLIKFDYELDGHTDLILSSELIIISPGINPNSSLIKNCIKNQIPIVSEIEFASWFTKIPIIAVTGSNGKSTTVNIINNMFNCAEISCQLGGNFGTPFSELVLSEMKNPNSNQLYILEISSFQLEHIYHFSPNYSIILNISPDHLDRHGTIENYLNQKLKISKNLREPGWLIYNSGDILLSNQLHDYERCIPFSRDYSDQALLSHNSTEIYLNNSNKDVLIYISDIGLKGMHNIDNALAASTLGLVYGLKHKYISQALQETKPLPHRMEFIQCINDVEYYNDSKATNIASTIVAIKSFQKNIILILGGRDKGETDYQELLEFTTKQLKLIITYGEAGKKIKDLLIKKYNIEFYLNFKEATKKAIERSINGDIVLLSPSCSSFDQFNNYEDRGNYFKKILTEKSYLC